jgi:hypothetical protein
MQHQRVEEWEEKLNALLKQIDHELEERFGSRLRPHPARPRRGSTANPQLDGLIRVTASFSAGFGTELGRGYVVRAETVSLDPLPAEMRDAIETLAVERIRRGLKEAFPNRDLAIRRDGATWKIVGDLQF